MLFAISEQLKLDRNFLFALLRWTCRTPSHLLVFPLIYFGWTLWLVAGRKMPTSNLQVAISADHQVLPTIKH